MATISDHYDKHLAEYYSWLFGGLEQGVRTNEAFFAAHGVHPAPGARALDLGCGSGFQSIPLAHLGHAVTAVDVSRRLIGELKAQGPLPIKTVIADLVEFSADCPEQFELVVCMGDTLTHLPDREAVTTLFANVRRRLAPGGRFIITYRDLSRELTELDRFIPVNSDQDLVFTCFLEYEPERVRVHDLIYRREDGRWHLQKSFYHKLRLPGDWTLQTLENSGFTISLNEQVNGLTTIIASRP